MKKKANQLLTYYKTFLKIESPSSISEIIEAEFEIINNSKEEIKNSEIQHLEIEQEIQNQEQNKQIQEKEEQIPNQNETNSILNKKEFVLKIKKSKSTPTLATARRKLNDPISFIRRIIKDQEMDNETKKTKIIKLIVQIIDIVEKINDYTVAKYYLDCFFENLESRTKPILKQDLTTIIPPEEIEKLCKTAFEKFNKKNNTS